MKKPNRKDYNVTSQMHAAMNDWACLQDKHLMQVTVVFSDCSGPDDKFVEVFKRAKKDVSYKAPDGITYEVQVDTGKFVNTFINGLADEVGITELKKAFADWVKPSQKGVSIVSIKWEKI